MAKIIATLHIDGDRWAKHPYGVVFDDPECNAKFARNWLDDREDCYRCIQKAKEAGYDVEINPEEYFY